MKRIVISQTRHELPAPHNTQSITLHIDYQVSSFGYVDPKGYTIITSVSDETIMNTIKEYYTNHFINGVAIWLDQIYDSGFRAFTLNLSCRTLLSTELIKKDVERQLYDIAYHIKRNYFADIVFYFHLTMSSSIFEGGGEELEATAALPEPKYQKTDLTPEDIIRSTLSLDALVETRKKAKPIPW